MQAFDVSSLSVYRLFFWDVGTAGYGNDSWAIGQSYADNPVTMPSIYDPSQPLGSRWSHDNLSASTINRMYHSSAVLLPDGSVFVSGSNPNADYNVGPNVEYPTEYRTERFYPSYYSSRRPQPQGLPSSISYGGSYFNVSLSKDDLFGNVNNAQNTTVVLIRPGFSTHALSMGQRFVQLNNTYTGNEDGSATLHVSQMPPNAAILAPGPACELKLHVCFIFRVIHMVDWHVVIFVVVDGVPSVGMQVMVGSGQIGTQPTSAVADLPSPTITNPPSTSTSKGNSKSGALSIHQLQGPFGLFSLHCIALLLSMCFILVR